MIRNLKALGLALVAVLAMSAVVASTASAEFEAEAPNTTLTVSSSGMQKIALTLGGTAIECTTIAFSNSTMAFTPDQSLNVSPAFSNCENFLGAPTSVKVTQCMFDLELGPNWTTGTFTIWCFGGGSIDIKVGSICAYTISGLQESLQNISYSNQGTGTTREVEMRPKVGGIWVTRTTNHFFCPEGGTTGTYTGSMTVTGENAEGAHVGVFVD